MNEVVIGTERQFGQLPAEVQIDRGYYYLIKDDEDGYRLVSRFCPHAGYLVEAEGDEFYCPMHGWAFDLKTGACLNVSDQGLRMFEVFVREGELVALL